MGAMQEGTASLARRHYMATMDTNGDTRVQWDPGKPAEVEMARNAFDHLTRQGYRAFRVNEEGGQGEPLNAFDPSARAIVMVPRIVGG